MGDVTRGRGLQTVVAHGGTVQRGMADTRMERDSAGSVTVFWKFPDTVGAGKMHVRQMAKVDIRMDFNQLPVFLACSLAVPVVGFRWEAVVGMQCRYASVVPCLFLCWFVQVPVWRYKETFFF